jgi:hypothetical protein
MPLESAHIPARQHAFTFLNAREREGLTVFSRRSVLKASLAGVAGLTLPGLLRLRAETGPAGRLTTRSKAVILLWMTGGQAHYTWDPPEMLEIRGPFGDSKASRARVCIFRRWRRCSTALRSSAGGLPREQHEPKVMTASSAAEPRTNTGTSLPGDWQHRGEVAWRMIRRCRLRGAE